MTSKVISVGQEYCMIKEGKAGGAITPGHVVSRTSTANQVVVRPASVKRQPLMVALANEIFGQDISVAYASTDTLAFGVLPPGVEFYGLTASGAVTLAIGDLLKPVNGELVIIGANEEALAVAIARSAVSKGSGAAVRVLAEAL